MRAARLVGLSQDGRSLIVATDTGGAGSGEQFALDNDDRLRAALRGDRPRLGQLEIEMETVLSPREIQSRIRSGEDLEDVARIAGMPIDRVERFAAPVLAEREHVASLAMSSSVRRRGETSGHRALRMVVQERLHGRGVDTDSVAWDSFRLADGRWGVTASYHSGEAQRRAEFIYDLSGRYSVAANDDARWVLGEHSSSRGPQPNRRRPTPGEVDDEAFEPTLDLSDELALVRAVSEPAPAVAAAEFDAARPDAASDEAGDGPDLAPVHRLHALPPGAEDGEPVRVSGAEADIPAEGSTVVATEHFPANEAETATGQDMSEDQEDLDAAGGLDTLYDMLDGVPASDAAAVPDGAVVADDGWEPSIVVDYPVEPELEDLLDRPLPPALAEHFPEVQELPEEIDEVEREGADADSEPDLFAEEASGAQAEPEDEPQARPVLVVDEVVEARVTVEETVALVEAPAEDQAPAAEARPEVEPALIPEPEPDPEPTADPEPEAKPRATRRKRAAVPSWDEIMFGGPKKG